MKIKLPTMKVGAIFLIFIMGFSTIAFAFLQTVMSPPRQEVRLPGSNIIDYELTIEQERLALNLGRTVATFYYYNGCLECTEQLAFLEYMTNEFSDQVIVEKILTEKTTSLSITSYNGQELLNDATQEEMFDAFCELMTKPPIVCATRKV